MNVSKRRHFFPIQTFRSLYTIIMRKTSSSAQLAKRLPLKQVKVDHKRHSHQLKSRAAEHRTNDRSARKATLRRVRSKNAYFLKKEVQDKKSRLNRRVYDILRAGRRR